MKITTDKFGEVSLNLLLVNAVLHYGEDLNSQRFDAVYKLHLYLINKILRALILTQKLDEDYWMEIDTLLTEIESKIHSIPYLEKLCINNGLDFNWLQADQIPDHMDLVVKDIRNQGFLK